MKWFKKKPKFYEKIDIKNIRPLDFQQDAIDQTLRFISTIPYFQGGRLSGKSITRVLIAAALIDNSDYIIVKRTPYK
jgi:hypothetical protein